MSRRLALLAVVLFAFLATPSIAAAAQRFASPTGTSGDDCSQAHPCSIGKAITAPGSGIEVIVLPGTYDIAVNGLSTQDGMNVHGQDGSPRPVVNNTSTIGLAAVGNGSTVRYLRITATGANPSGGGAALDVQNGSTAENVIAEGLATHNAGGCQTEGVTATIRNSVCKADGDNAGVFASDDTNQFDTLSLRNVTAISVSGDGILAANTGSHTVVINVVNSIASGGGHDVAAIHSGSAAANVDLSYSNFSSTSANDVHAVIVDQGHNQSAPPLLTSDFHQQPGSPTIDAGVNDSANGATDFDGDPRALGSGVTDIGADELVPAPEVTTDDATGVGQTTGTLNGTVNPESRDTTYHFDFGTSTAYGFSTPTTGVGSGLTPVAVSAPLSPIVPGTTYHYRLVATNNVGTTFGPDKQFTTAAATPTNPLLTTPPFPALTLIAQTVTVDTSGNALLDVTCPATAVGNCVGTDTLKTAAPVKVRAVAAKRKKKRGKVLTLGSANFSIPPGTKLKVRIKLSKQARKLLAKTKKLKAVETVVAHDSRNVSKTSTTTVTLKAPKAKKRKKH